MAMQDIYGMNRVQSTLNGDHIVVYTCVTNNYDDIAPVKSGEPGIRFVCFSDRPEKVPYGWEGQVLQSPRRLTCGHDVNRFHKLFPHRVLPWFRYSIYMDGNICFRDSFRTLVDKLHAANIALAAFSHPKRRTVQEESEICAKLGKFDLDDKAKSKAQLQYYQEQGFDLGQRVSANYLLIRDHAYPGLATAMSLWWSSLFEFTKRDQVSLNYVLWKTGLPWMYLDDDLGVDASYLICMKHRATLVKRMKEVAKKLSYHSI